MHHWKNNIVSLGIKYQKLTLTNDMTKKMTEPNKVILSNMQASLRLANQSR